MTANRPNLLKLLAPLAAFGCVFLALMALSPASDIDLPQRGAGIERRRAPGRLDRPAHRHPPARGARGRGRRPRLRLAGRRLPAEGPRHRRSLLLLARRQELRPGAAKRRAQPRRRAGRRDARRTPPRLPRAAASWPRGASPGPGAHRLAPGDRRRPDRARPLRRRRTHPPAHAGHQAQPDLIRPRVLFPRAQRGPRRGAPVDAAGRVRGRRGARERRLPADPHRRPPAPAQPARRGPHGLPRGAGPPARVRPRGGGYGAGPECGRRPGRRRPAAPQRGGTASAHEPPDPARRHRRRPRGTRAGRSRPRRGARPAAAAGGGRHQA